nr:alpha/beta fold hydrolase [uncultured Treponema sp.]
MSTGDIKYKFLHTLWFLFCSVVVLFTENFILLKSVLTFGAIFFIQVCLIAATIYINIHPDLVNKIKNPKLHHCAGGLFLLNIFLFTTVISICVFIYGSYGLRLKTVSRYESNFFASVHFYGVKNLLWIFFVEFAIFWNGIIRVYIYSKQLGIKLRIIGAVCGLIPVVHLVVLFKIIKIVNYEVQLESSKEELNESRKDQKICATKYPVVMIHGIFFRDFKYFNYWGRIPVELEKNGASVYYGNHESAAPVEKSAEQLAQRIKEILKETGAEKVNIIAHSKGGLDSRYMISKCGMEKYVASLTTINTPHRGCEFADYLLNKIPEAQVKMVASVYNNTLKNLGDKNPDFVESVKDLTASACEEFNENVKDKSEVYYQSVGSKLNIPQGGQFPLNYSYRLVKEFDGPNDGLVGERSFKWGTKYTFLTVKGVRGISHGDMIDLNRENIPGFDVREFYVQLVAGLKERGL